MIGFLRSFYALALIVILSVTVLSLATAQAQQDPLFLPGVIYDTGGANPNAVVIADVNGDGKPDLIIANGPPNLDHGTVGVLLANGDGTFQPAVIYDAWNQEDFSASPQTIAVADINGDHKPDLSLAANRRSTGLACSLATETARSNLSSALA